MEIKGTWINSARNYKLTNSILYTELKNVRGRWKKGTYRIQPNMFYCNKDGILSEDLESFLLYNETNGVIKMGNQTITIIEESNSNQAIPLKLWQTWHTKQLSPAMKVCINELKENNPEFEHYLYDIYECREFIYANFGKQVGLAYDSLIPLAYKSDLWRLCVLYIYGGIYLDCKYKCINGFKLITLTDQEHFCEDRFKKVIANIPMDKRTFIPIYNAIIVSPPKNNKLLAVIYQIVDNVKNKYYGYTALYPTGPALLGLIFNEFKDVNISLKFMVNEKIIYNEIEILEQYQTYREEQLASNIEHYNNLWAKKQVYQNDIMLTINKMYKKKREIRPYCIYFPQFHEIQENNINFYKGYISVYPL